MRRLGPFLFLALAACSEAKTPPPSAPDYLAPGAASAKEAFKYALATDLKNNPFEEKDLPEMNAITASAHRRQNDQRIGFENLQEALGAFQKVDVGACVFEPVSKKKAPRASRQRVPTPPATAYGCDLSLHYQINPPYGKKLKATGSGYFFRDEETGQYVYPGSYPHPYD
jgi:hypothetical protein